MRPQRIRINHDEILEALREAGKEETTDNALMMAYKIGFRDCREKEVDIIKALADLVFLHGCEQEGIESGMPTPDQWEQAVDNAVIALSGYIGMKTYTRELPKTRARIIAEEIAAAQISNKKDLVDIIEQTINTHIKELKG